MLKTLKLTSLAAVILTICGVVVMVVFGLKGNPEVKDFLDSPGIVERFKSISSAGNKKADTESPLVVQARAFALRIDPPPPPKPVVKDTPKPPVATARPQPKPKPVIPKPKATVKPTKYDLLATVVYQSVPEKSLALFKSAGNQQEWFRQGEKLGNLEISEIKDGSVVFTQNGKNPQEQFVPDKPKVKSLLKGEQSTPVVSRAGVDTGGIAVQLPAVDETQPEKQVGGARMTNVGNVRAIRSGEVEATKNRPDLSSRIRRVRSVPRQPTAREQSAEIEQTLTGLEEIMNRQDDSMSAEDRAQEKEMWADLINQLKSEKENLDKLAEVADKSEEDAEKSDGAPSKETDAEKKSKNEDQPAPADPNKTE